MMAHMSSTEMKSNTELRESKKEKKETKNPLYCRLYFRLLNRTPFLHFLAEIRKVLHLRSVIDHIGYLWPLMFMTRVSKAICVGHV